MKVKKIAIIVCDSGLGHLVRCVKIANKLCESEHEITLFCNINKLKKIKIKVNNKLFFKKFISGHDKDLNFKNYNYNCADKLPDLKKFDLIVSDNLLETLEKYPKSILIANFFWHKVIKNFKNYKKNQDLLKKYKPLIICNKYVAHGYVNYFKNVRQVGFFSEFKKYEKKKKKILLISEGTAITEVKNNFKLIKIIKSSSNFFDEIILDPKYFKDPKFKKKIIEFNPQVKCANYSEAMFKKISHAIIKPGLGTVSNCISNNIQCLYYYKGYNKEFELNAKMLENFGLGKKFNIINFKKFLNSYCKINYYKNQYIKFKKMEWFADKITAKIILQQLIKNEK